MTGDVEWPVDANQQALALPPLGVRYHMAPLAMVAKDGTLTDLRKQIPPMATL